LLSTINSNFAGLKVVVDCANGAASFVAPEVLKRAGAEVIAISASPNGLNINDNCGSTHLTNLITTVKAEKADIGIAHDGDADRVLAVDHDGNVIDGDFILGILAGHTDLPTKTVVGTVMTNLGLIRALESQGISFVATPVGDRYVLEEMMAQGHTLGGEQSGHIIMRKYANTGDGLLTALHLISHLAASKKSLKELSSFMTRYPQVLINVGGVARDRLNANLKIQEAVAEVEKTLGNKGRVLLRASGTEPLIRVMIEAEDSVAATKFAESLAALVKSELSI
jgi:phosphoglucosamine mutase